MTEYCKFCEKRVASFQCASCKKASYCSYGCQGQDWVRGNHNKECFFSTDNDGRTFIGDDVGGGDLETNTQVSNGRYVLKKKLGQGSFGSVWMATDRNFNARTPDVVIKFQSLGTTNMFKPPRAVRAPPRKNFLTQEDLFFITYIVEVLAQEITIADENACDLVSCQSNSFIDVIGITVYGVIVFPFQAEHTLNDYLKLFSVFRKVALENFRTKEIIFKRILKAVEKMHGNKLVQIAHMDLKPRNILVIPNTRFPIEVKSVSILDLGLACARREGNVKEMNGFINVIEKSIRESIQEEVVKKWFTKKLDKLKSDIIKSVVCTNRQGTRMFMRIDDKIKKGKEFEFGVRQDINALGVILYMMYFNLTESKFVKKFDGAKNIVSSFKSTLISEKESIPRSIWNFIVRCVFLNKESRPFFDLEEMIDVFESTIERKGFLF